MQNLVTAAYDFRVHGETDASTVQAENYSFHISAFEAVAGRRAGSTQQQCVALGRTDLDTALFIIYEFCTF
jgi:hypothetical protein